MVPCQPGSRRRGVLPWWFFFLAPIKRCQHAAVSGAGALGARVIVGWLLVMVGTPPAMGTVWPPGEQSSPPLRSPVRGEPRAPTARDALPGRSGRRNPQFGLGCG